MGSYGKGDRGFHSDKVINILLFITVITMNIILFIPFTSIKIMVFITVFDSFLIGVIVHFIETVNKERYKYKKSRVTDSLTDIYTLTHVIGIGEKAIKNKDNAAIYVIDIDHFERFNDNYGYLTGNKLLLQVADVLKEETINMNGVVGRLGGDEYIILLIGSSREEADKFLDKLNNRLKEELFECDPELDQVKISCSIGMAYSSCNSPIYIDELLHHADTNMYYNKQKKGTDIELDVQHCNMLPKDAIILLRVLYEKDIYSYVHSRYVVYYSTMLAKALNLPKEMIEQIIVGAWMHDIGKICIPDNILRKKSKLTDEEYEIIKTHVEREIDILRSMNLTEVALRSIKYHHERYDGKGYPYRILAKDTPLESKIIQIADAFSAMTAKRVYRELMTKEEALREIKRNSGRQFDPELANVFISIFKN